MAPLTLLTIDDHPVVLSGLRLLLEGDPRFELCAVATTPAEARRQAEALRPDMIVTDLVLGGADGVALIKDLRAILPNAAILVYLSQDEMLWAHHVLRAGARGYVSKAEPLDTVAVALTAISRGEIHVSAAVQRLLDNNAEGAMFEPHDVSVLSARELQILQLIGSGTSLQDISQTLGLSVKTTGTYRERLKIKLGFDSAQALVGLVLVGGAARRQRRGDKAAHASAFGPAPRGQRLARATHPG